MSRGWDFQPSKDAGGQEEVSRGWGGARVERARRAGRPARRRPVGGARPAFAPRLTRRAARPTQAPRVRRGVRRRSRRSQAAASRHRQPGAQRRAARASAARPRGAQAPPRDSSVLATPESSPLPAQTHRIQSAGPEAPSAARRWPRAARRTRRAALLRASAGRWARKARLAWRSVCPSSPGSP